jgi:hypothetical protein
MKTLKQEALQAISNMPNSANIDDIMYQLYVMEKVRKGRDAVKMEIVCLLMNCER